MTVYSHSRISTFEQCPLKFKFRYLDKIPPKIRIIEAHLGKVVHSTLEWIYNEVKKERIPAIDEVISYYASNWIEKYDSDLVIIRKQSTTEDYFSKGVQFLLNYYSQHKPFDDNTLEVEKKISISLDETGNYKIQGFIDRLSYNIKDDEYEIHDYKTSNSIPNPDETNGERQLALYCIAIKELSGKDKKVCLVWHYLAHNKKICVRKTETELQKLKEETIDKIEVIESTKKFPPYISRLCDWCEYSPICPAWDNSSNYQGIQKKL